MVRAERPVFLVEHVDPALAVGRREDNDSPFLERPVPFPERALRPGKMFQDFAGEQAVKGFRLERGQRGVEYRPGNLRIRLLLHPHAVKDDVAGDDGERETLLYLGEERKPASGVQDSSFEISSEILPEELELVMMEEVEEGQLGRPAVLPVMADGEVFEDAVFANSDEEPPEMGDLIPRGPKNELGFLERVEKKIGVEPKVWGGKLRAVFKGSNRLVMNPAEIEFQAQAMDPVRQPEMPPAQMVFRMVLRLERVDVYGKNKPFRTVQVYVQRHLALEVGQVNGLSGRNNPNHGRDVFFREGGIVFL